MWKDTETNILTANLSEKQKEAVNTIDEDVEIIACAGAGKTGVVTRRIINILKCKPDIKPENIVAFTFTKKAAEELKSRIYKYGKDVLGHTQGFANMYVGTIHGFCLKMLQEFVTEFQQFSVLDEVQTKLFVERYYEECGMETLELLKYIETNLFITTMGILNENWADKNKWDSKTVEAFEKYQSKMYSEKKFDYSLILREMVCQLQNNKKFREIIRERVKYLTVDEYQDTNPIQEMLVSIMKDLGANICVVGDDDQTIYKFRGSDSNNILTFKERYNIQNYILLDTDYRSTEGIVDVARKVIVNNDNRLPKTMQSGCSTVYDEGDIAYKEFHVPDEEYEFIAERIEQLHAAGVSYSEIAVLMRKKKIGADIAEVLEKHNIPFVIEGMNELFNTKECQAAKSIYDYLLGEIDSIDVFRKWSEINYPFNKKELADCLQYLMSIDIGSMKYYPELNLQRIFHDFIKKLPITEDGRLETEIILYNLGKFSQVINDFETINFTVKPKFKLKSFCSFLKYTATGYYPEGYLSNSYTKPEAVSLMTIHQSKGLEYAAVFIPMLNKNFFPAQKIGGKSVWHVIDKKWITGSDRFDGDIEDERKLFYVAVTRAKKYLYLTRSDIGKTSVFFTESHDSPYMLKFNPEYKYDSAHLPEMKKDSISLTLNFSLLEDYFECPYRFKLSMFYGFVQPIVEALGYGNVMHDIVRNIHNAYISGETINSELVNKIIDETFYLPYATQKIRENMYKGIKKSIEKYVSANESEFKNIIMAEKDIEIDMGDGIKVNGRIDLVKNQIENGDKKVTIVDFKTANKRVIDSINKEQLKIYALGYQELTGKQADYMEIYHLDSENSARADVTDTVIENVKNEIKTAADNIRKNNLPRRCDKEHCSKCHLSHLCLSKKEQISFGA